MYLLHAMEKYFTESVQIILTFVAMGVLGVVISVSESKAKVSWRQQFQMLYINVITGWGFFSLITAIWGWFGEWPQYVFTIMCLTYIGVQTLNWIKENWTERKNLLSGILTYIANKLKDE